MKAGDTPPVGSTRVIKPDLRIVAATNKNLKRLVEKGVMREDFFYRVHIIPSGCLPCGTARRIFHCWWTTFYPPLVMRGRFPPWGAKLWRLFSGTTGPAMSGNFRTSFTRYMTLGKIDFMGNSSDRGADAQEQVSFVRESSDLCGPLNEIVSEFEKEIILNALEENRWQKARTALALGIHRKTLFTKMKKTWA